MSSTGVVARLAMRELWISFRLLLLLAAYIGAGASVALFPAPLSITLERMGLAVAAAMTLGAAIGAWSLSRDRVLGRTGWLVTRSISRATVIVGWFLALGLVSILGLLAVGVLGWLAASTPGTRMDQPQFAATFAAIACSALAFVALGILTSTLFRPPLAAMVSATTSAGIMGVAWVAMPRIALPAEALAQLPALVSPVAVAAQGAGASLAVAGLLLVVARLALERAEL